MVWPNFKLIKKYYNDDDDDCYNNSYDNIKDSKRSDSMVWLNINSSFSHFIMAYVCFTKHVTANKKINGFIWLLFFYFILFFKRYLTKLLQITSFHSHMLSSFKDIRFIHPTW